MEIKTGGPAFPESCNGQIISGMTLRDYFAGQIIPALIMSSNGDHYINNVAYSLDVAAYKMADAMILEREK